MSGPIFGIAATLTPLHVVPGSTRGPDGKPLGAYERFCARVLGREEEVPEELDASVVELPDGTALVMAATSGAPYLLDAQGRRHYFDGEAAE